MSEKKNKPVNEIATREEEVLSFWKERGIFQKTLEKDVSNGNFVFYDGPPFATGLPHYGHILAGTIKDVIPRYQTMKGKFVRRVWGWDCHGLPIENMIQEELGLHSKKDIDEYGVERFNTAARDSVLRFDKEWKEVIPRMGRWIDMDSAYKTMDSTFTESVWWAFKTLYEKDLIYKSFKSMHICPHCETTLSNFEVNQGYKEIKDISVTVAFRLREPEKIVEGGTDVSLLAWTTTPWTLPGNAALAVNKELEYTVIEQNGRYLIVATDCVSRVAGEDASVVSTLRGKDLIGLSYEPIFNYYEKEYAENVAIWKVYHGEFVTTEEGTGAVHIAPAFGNDDFELARAHDVPFIQHVTFNGVFKDEVADFKGMPVKPKDDHQAADIEVIKYLAEKGALFSKEKLTHSYPHCWRCDTPLLNYATDSWFVSVVDIKKDLIEENSKVEWTPEHIGENRFGRWLEEAKDWAISRSRFWGAPMPVWQCESCENRKVIGSMAELARPSTNSYCVMRHGEAENNSQGVLSSDPTHPHHLTEKGKEQVKKRIAVMESTPDIIISSDFTRTRETAELLAEELGKEKESVILDSRLRELDFGEFHLQPVEKYHRYFDDWKEGFDTPLPGGESFTDVKRRLGELLYELEETYSDKRILLVTHETPAWLLFSVSECADMHRCIEVRGENDRFINNAELRELSFHRYPHNDDFELDLHRPYIDEVEFPCDCGGVMQRIPEVFDTWFDSGSMPFAQVHYPFQNREIFEQKDSPLFPADFIAEGQDQTRGWFYTLLVLSTALFGKAPYKNVVVTGTVLAEDGKKMSKRLKNYPDPMEVVGAYGADALRYTLLSSPVVKAEDLALSERQIDEVSKKVIGRLFNVLSFAELYGGDAVAASESSDNVLDRWVRVRLDEITVSMTENFDNYHLDKASRALGEFVDDLSTWYLRRSRDRMRNEGEEKDSAVATLIFVLKRFAVLSAPILPFSAEALYQKVRGETDPESVHLENWPTAEKVEEELLEAMKEVRSIVSHGLEKRASAGFKVRQPLRSLSATLSPTLADNDELLALIREELNVKEVIHTDGLEEPKLDTELDDELRREGEVRELIRSLQELRKKADLTPDRAVTLEVATDESGRTLLEEAKGELERVVRIRDMKFSDRVEEGSKIELTTSAMTVRLLSQ